MLVGEARLKAEDQVAQVRQLNSKCSDSSDNELTKLCESYLERS